jgi:hypothetical protein
MHPSHQLLVPVRQTSRFIVIVGILLIALALAAIGVGGAAWLAGERWQIASVGMTTRLVAASTRSEPLRYSSLELAGLPAPVTRYFRTALSEGRPIIRRARITWHGEFNMGKPGRDNWKPFTAEQLFVPAAPGFVWDARIAFAPGIPVLVRDALVDGVGSMHGAILGLIPVVNVSNTSTIAVSALLRYLAEAVWFPTALLPSQGVHWSAIDDERARASLTIGATTGSVVFRFGADGLIASVFSDERTFDGEEPPTKRPWEGALLHYDERNGVKVPIEAYVQWNLPSGAFQYWRGRPVAIDYEAMTTGAER